MHNLSFGYGCTRDIKVIILIPRQIKMLKKLRGKQQFINFIRPWRRGAKMVGNHCINISPICSDSNYWV